MKHQLTQSMLYICITIDVRFNGINDTVISYATFNNIVICPRLLAYPAVNNKVKPFLVISTETLYTAVNWKRKLISVDNSIFCPSDGFDADCPF